MKELSIQYFENNLIYNEFHKKSINLIKKSFDEYGLNISTLSQMVFDKPTKKSRKFLISILEKKLCIGWIYIFKVLSKSAKINQDLIFSEMQNINLEKNFHSDLLTVSFLKSLKKTYNDKRLLKLILSSNFEHNNDIQFMLKKINSEIDKDFLPKKPSNFNDIHKSCERMVLKLSSKNFDLNQRDDIVALDNKEINNNLYIRVPKTHYDLIDLGEDLNFCIGNGYYSEEVRQGNCSIVSIYDTKNKPVYGIQFNRYSIKQAYGFDNEIIPNHILVDIQNALISRPEVPNDFIAISDSTWIQGFKYDDKDLYLLLNGKIYIYFDVERSDYEELIHSERKGSFVNQIIKKNYKYEKVS